MSNKKLGGKGGLITIDQIKREVAAFQKESAAGGKADSNVLEIGSEDVMSKSERRRLNALKNEQLKFTELEAKFYEELHQLECKYNKLYEPVFEKRRQIVSGEYEPSEEEAKWSLDENKENAEPTTTTTTEEQSVPSEKKEEKGIKNFWLETLQAVRMTSELVAEVDDPILAYLQDIKVKYFDEKPYGYTLEFHFAENPHFTNKVLTKTYELKIEVDSKDPFSFEGPDLSKVTGCKIDWKPGMNVTVKTIKKKIKSKNKKAPPKVITKEEKQDSFFNFFETPKQGGTSGDEVAVVGSRKGNSKSMSSNDDLDEDDYEDNDDILMFADFEIAQQIREKVIPKAVLYWCGELDDLDDEYDDYDEEDEDGEDEEGDEEDEEDEEDEDDDDDDDDDDEGDKKGGKGGKGGKHAGKHGKAAGGKGGKTGSGGGTEATPSECKQN